MLIKFTYVDAQTRRPVTDEPAAAGPILPDVPGIAIDFANESEWPCPAPIFYGHCDDNTNPIAQGILDVLTQEAFFSALDKEQLGRIARKKEQVRGRRSWLLTNSDWSQLVDVSLTDAEKLDWQDYRQQLREVTLQSRFPMDIEWPIAPDADDYVSVVRVPQSCSMAQMRQALFDKGKLTEVDAAIVDMGGMAAIQWEYETVVRRNHELVIAMQQLLVWTDKQMNELFTLAGEL